MGHRLMRSGRHEGRLFALASLLLLLGLAPAPAGSGDEERPLTVANRACLFLDDYFLAEQAGVKRVWHQGQPKPVIIDRSEPWEAAGKPGGLHLYGSVVFDPADRSYKMYYQVWSPYVPGGYLVCLALSKDAKTWQKPHLGQVEFQGSRENNILLAGAAHPNVFLDSSDKRPEGRYKMLPWCMGCVVDGKKLNSLHLLESGDGIRWRYVRPIGVPSPKDDTAAARTVLDTYHILWDPLRQNYFGTFRAFPSHPGLPGFFRDEKYKVTYGLGGHRRAVAISTTPSLDKPWPASVTVLRADKLDDRRVAGLSEDPKKLNWAELYYLPAFNYGNHYVGLMTLLDFVDETDRKFGAGDVQLAFSHDGKVWHRPLARHSAIARGEDKKLFATYAMDNEPLDMGREMWVFYTEANGAHPITPLEKFVSRIRTAAWRKDGFVSLDCDDKGSLTTKPLVFSGKELRLNFHSRDGGSARVSVLDAKGKPVPGFDLKDCQPLTGDEVSCAVTWEQRPELARLQGQTVRLRFELSRCRLWSFRFAP